MGVSEKPWLYVRAEEELDFLPALFDDIRAGSENAEIKVYPGEGHGTSLIKNRPEVENFFLEWIITSVVQ